MSVEIFQTMNIVSNTKTVTCDLCKNKNKIILYIKSVADFIPRKSEKTDTNVLQSNEPMEVVSTSKHQSSSKKKRKKEKNAGLLYSLNKDDVGAARKTVNLCQKTQTLNIQQKLQNIPNQSINKKTNNNPNRTVNKNKTKVPKGPKLKSKNILHPPTKRHNLLLLADALKAKSNNQSNANSQADKLKQMLR